MHSSGTSATSEATPYEDTGGTDAPSLQNVPQRSNQSRRSSSMANGLLATSNSEKIHTQDALSAAFEKATPGPGKPSRTLAHQRAACLDEIVWSTERSGVDSYIVDDIEHNPYNEDHVRVLECWRHQQSQTGRRTTTSRYRLLSEIEESPAPSTSPAATKLRRRDLFERELRMWLDAEGEHKPPVVEGAVIEGGIRLVMCDRPNMTRGMTMSREAYEMIESDFALHEATLPFFFDNGGRYTIFKSRDEAGKVAKLHVIVKAIQKVEIANFLLSLTYDVATKSTRAFICGDGVVFYRSFDDSYGHLERQLLEAIANGGGDLWTNPLLLPVVILEVCADRALARTYTIEKRLVSIENELGVTFAGWSGDRRDRSNWPMDIKVKWATRELHSTMPQILFLSGVTAWQKRYGDWLDGVVDELNRQQNLMDEKLGFEELKSAICGICSSVEGSVEFFQTLKDRAQSQIDLLFNVIGQRDSLISQKANDLNFEVARSTKEDSISMSTFTFITAVFLPPSFIATMFSMSMFDWSGGDNGESGNSPTVSRRFWIFWVVAAPLTGAVMASWYWWDKHADRRWMERLAKVQESAGMLVDPETREDTKRRKEHEKMLKEKERVEEIARRKVQEEKQGEKKAFS